MKLVILVSNEESTLRAIKDYIPDEYTLMECNMGSKGLQMLKNIVSAVVLVDTTVHGALSWIKDASAKRPDLTYLCISNEKEKDLDNSLYKYFYDFIYLPFLSKQVSVTLERAWERVQLRFEVQDLKKMGSGLEKTRQANFEHPSKLPRKERILCDFSRALSSNFNAKRLMELFMNSVTELVPVGKLSILLYDETLEEYKVAAQNGLDPCFYAGLLFRSSSGLMSWLLEEGRILRTDEPACSPAFKNEALQELKLLHAVVCIPLLAHGQLVGALNLGPKVTGSPFHDEELEILYILCGNVAMALRDIGLHHQILNQKIYIENILQRMNSGAAAINREERIITFNSRAGELLSLSPQEVMGEDLRKLPSPLGDLLYETMTTGKAYLKEEVNLAEARIPLEVNTYQLSNVDGEVLGSVMIFDDISARKQLEAERRQADQLDVLNKFVGQLAHEIKNPMVAIQTFSELLTEKYEDSSFREFFTYTVRQEVKRLNELVEQLIAFSTSLSYKYIPVDVHEILDMGLLLLQEQGMGQETTVETSYNGGSLNLRADKTIMARAFSYLLRNSFKSVEKGGMIHIDTSYIDNMFPSGGGVSIRFWDIETKVGKEDVEKMFDPLSSGNNGYISLALPVSRKIIEDHGGFIKASVTKDKSLEFEVSLPIFLGEGG
ncbi:MAG: histidine kinase dimerization/phospho-acceptor domain-containing protein [Bacillota bacterium]|nr:histidine kinase dimerization/phospho-acceptor domain-containing protein [Bacillota bacterium]